MSCWASCLWKAKLSDLHFPTLQFINQNIVCCCKMQLPQSLSPVHLPASFATNSFVRQRNVSIWEIAIKDDKLMKLWQDYDCHWNKEDPRELQWNVDHVVSQHTSVCENYSKTQLPSRQLYKSCHITLNYYIYENLVPLSYCQCAKYVHKVVISCM